MGTPLTTVQTTINNREQWHKEALDAGRLVQSLPKGIQELEGCTSCDIYSDRLEITFSFVGDDGEVKAEACAKVLKMAGVTGLKAQMGYSQEWSYVDGSIVLPHEQEVAFTIRGCKKPPECRIEEYTETLTRYRAICKETDEPI